LKQANRDCYKKGYLIINEEDELPEVDGEQELPTCHDCDYWNEMIASTNKELVALRDKPTLGVAELEQEERKVTACLKSLVLGQTEHQRKAH